MPASTDPLPIWYSIMYFTDRDDIQEILEYLASAGILNHNNELSTPYYATGETAKVTKRTLPAVFAGTEKQASHLAAEIAAYDAVVFGFPYGPHQLAEDTSWGHWSVDGVACYLELEFMEKKFGKPDLVFWGKHQLFLYRTPGLGGQTSSWDNFQKLAEGFHSIPGVAYVDIALDCPWSLVYEQVASLYGYTLVPDGMLQTVLEGCKAYVYDKARTLWAGGVFEGPVFTENSRPITENLGDSWDANGYTRFECRITRGANVSQVCDAFMEFWARVKEHAVSIPLAYSYDAAFAAITHTEAVIVALQNGLYVLVHAYGKRAISPDFPNLCTGVVFTGSLEQCVAWVSRTQLPGVATNLHISATETTVLRPRREEEWGNFYSWKWAKPTLTHQFRTNGKNTTSRAKWTKEVDSFWPRELAKVFRHSLDKSFPVFSPVCLTTVAKETPVFEVAPYLENAPTSTKECTQRWSRVPKVAVILAVENGFACINGKWTEGVPAEVLAQHTNGKLTILVNGGVASLEQLKNVSGKKTQDLLASYGAWL